MSVPGCDSLPAMDIVKELGTDVAELTVSDMLLALVTVGRLSEDTWRRKFSPAGFHLAPLFSGSAGGGVTLPFPLGEALGARWLASGSIPHAEPVCLNAF